MNERRFSRAAGPVLAGLGLLAFPGAAKRAAGQDFLAMDERKPTVMEFDFSTRVMTHAHFRLNSFDLLAPHERTSYLRLKAANRTRPLFITGDARRGRMTLTFKPDPVADGGYAVSCEGTAVADYDDYQVTPGAESPEHTGTEWLKERNKWRVIIRRVHGVKSSTKDKALHAFLERRYVPRNIRAGERTDPVAFLRAKLDVEIRSPTGTVRLTDQDADIGVTVLLATRYGGRHPYWQLTISSAMKADAAQLGLRDAGPAPVDIAAVIGTFQWVPMDVRQEETPDAESISAGEEGELGGAAAAEEE